MKQFVTILVFCLAAKCVAAQNSKDAVTKACLNYIEGFYEGDTTKLIESLKPSLYKFGYWKNKKTGKYDPDEYMTYRQALDYAKNVLEKKHFAKPDAPKKVEVLDIQNTIASAKVTAWWGVDYILLSKQNEKWMIEQVLWEGPLEK
ncbi:MAG: nuclear transport factor 2 family protein [Ferruginibacter sp.]